MCELSRAPDFRDHLVRLQLATRCRKNTELNFWRALKMEFYGSTVWGCLNGLIFEPLAYSHLYDEAL